MNQCNLSWPWGEPSEDDMIGLRLGNLFGLGSMEARDSEDSIASPLAQCALPWPGWAGNYSNQLPQVIPGVHFMCTLSSWCMYCSSRLEFT